MWVLFKQSSILLSVFFYFIFNIHNIKCYLYRVNIFKKQYKYYLYENNRYNILIFIMMKKENIGKLIYFY